MSFKIIVQKKSTKNIKQTYICNQRIVPHLVSLLPEVWAAALPLAPFPDQHGDDLGHSGQVVMIDGDGIDGNHLLGSSM